VVGVVVGVVVALGNWSYYRARSIADYNSRKP
jgi:hypothetical protein